PAKAHSETTGPEISTDPDGKVDIFVAGVGTGGTITGVGRFLKEKNEKIKIVAVEPKGSAVLSGKAAGAHGLQGIGAGFIPSVLDVSVIDEIIAVSEEEAYSSARSLAKNEGILCGISSGAALFAATVLAKDKANEGKNIVVLLPDTGDRYLSMDLFNE
ncbi:MAG: pyridoxal-phosphate dependent enzyme, partial [Clostridiales bacterium]|nr:pyridoxal-phosphate dependent enzyme [Candidatus Coliplasma equi]